MNGFIWNQNLDTNKVRFFILGKVFCFQSNQGYSRLETVSMTWTSNIPNIDVGKKYALREWHIHDPEAGKIVINFWKWEQDRAKRPFNQNKRGWTWEPRSS